MDLFDHPQTLAAPGFWWLPGFAESRAEAILAAIADVTRRAPWRQMRTPGGGTMSVQMSNCGRLGWISDARGYRYLTVDPASGVPWPAMPDVVRALALEAARQCEFPDFEPDACLINRYAPGAQMGLHQDRDERDLSQPIVSISLGLPAVFLLGGLQRRARTQQLALRHGDVLVWGGPARLRYHGVRPIAAANHARIGPWRINLTIRQAA